MSLNEKDPLSLNSPTSIFPSSSFFQSQHAVSHVTHALTAPVPPSVLPFLLSSESCHVPHGMNGLRLTGLSHNHGLTHTSVIFVSLGVVFINILNLYFNFFLFSFLFNVLVNFLVLYCLSFYYYYLSFNYVSTSSYLYYKCCLINQLK